MAETEREVRERDVEEVCEVSRFSIRMSVLFVFP